MMTEPDAPRPFRVVPAVTPDNEHFWLGGAEGELRMLRCQTCGWWIHPPVKVCPIDLSRDIRPEVLSGRGTLHSFTVNWQPWYPNLDPPYVVAVVELAEQENLRLTTNLVGAEPDDWAIGQPVRVTFEPYDDVWLPFFEPDPDGPAPITPASASVDPAVNPRPRRSNPPQPSNERQAVISGVGQSQIGRRIYRDPLELTVDACLAAIADAGLTRADIDGLSTYPGNMTTPPGFSGAGITEIHDALRLNLNWFSGGLELPGQLGSVVNAIAAVSAGLCNHVLCFRTVWEASAQGDQGRASVTSGGGGGSFKATGFMQWTLPFGAPSASNWIGMMAARHFHEFGTTREQLAQIPLNARRNAALNPNAIYRQPMTLDDYLSVRMVSTPLCLYDCDVPADGSTAIVVSAIETAPDLRSPVRIEAMAGVVDDRPSWDQWGDMSRVGYGAADAMWARTDLRPGDVDAAQLYDGFTIELVWWLEAMGFCGPGEAGAFVDGGKRIALGGDLPLNTWGGQLSGGRLHASFGHTAEAVRQLRGEAGDRQVKDAEVVAVTNVGGIEAGASLLTRW
jgi:acetyl-CoA acetyltransferase/uncharacterized OB-fold protein